MVDGHRRATPDDWPLVKPFFERNCRPRHPFRNESFWRWLTESPADAQAELALEDGRVIGHGAVNFGGGIVWGFMLMVDADRRGRGHYLKLLDVGHSLGRFAVTNVNNVAAALLLRAGWKRHPDLVRHVAVRPGTDARDAVQAVHLRGGRPTPSGHFWRQPGVDGLRLGGGTGVAQPKVGGLRAVDIDDAPELLDEAWDLGFRWVDYLTSTNDPVLDLLAPDAWTPDESSPVPWNLDPVVPGSNAQIRVLAKDPLPEDLVIRRTYCDHGRVGSLEPA